jgi:hypothetical protein
MKWFQFSLRRVLVAIFFCGVALGFTKAAFFGTMVDTRSEITLRFAYSMIAAAAFGAAVGTVFRNIYNGFAIGVFAAFLIYLLSFLKFVLLLR